MSKEELENIISIVSLNYDLSLWSSEKIRRFAEGLYLYLQPYLKEDHGKTQTGYITPETT
jgi:hypothetical protein